MRLRASIQLDVGNVEIAPPVEDNFVEDIDEGDESDFIEDEAEELAEAEG